MIPAADHFFPGDALYFTEVHHHAVDLVAGRVDDVAEEAYFKHIAVAVKMPALAGVIRDTVAGVEFEATSDAHACFFVHGENEV